MRAKGAVEPRPSNKALDWDGFDVARGGKGVPAFGAGGLSGTTRPSGFARVFLGGAKVCGGGDDFRNTGSRAVINAFFHPFTCRGQRAGRPGVPDMSGAASVASLFAQRVVVGVGDLAVSNSSAAMLSTYALGSCVGVIAYDPMMKCGGILHLMLPEASVSPQKAITQPAMFADTGLPLFFKALLGLKAERPRLNLFVAGGASVIAGQDPFRIGERNVRATMDFVAANGLRVVHRDTGGNFNRTVHLELGTGNVSLVTPSGKTQVALG